jgi:hypothetical protein
MMAGRILMTDGRQVGDSRTGNSQHSRFVGPGDRGYYD